MINYNMVPILRYIKKIPAGTMIVPLFLAAFINTFFPEILTIGGYTQALFSSDATDVMLALMMLFTGTQMDLKDLLTALRQGGFICSCQMYIWYRILHDCTKYFWISRNFWCLFISYIMCNYEL